MEKHHTRSRITHDLTYLLPHRRFVTVNGTPSASGFIVLIGAMIHTLHGVGEQLPAFGAQSAFGVTVSTAENFDHLSDGMSFTFQTVLIHR